MGKAAYTVEDRTTAQAILRYLVKHPRAKDTIDGIAQWWLEGETGKRKNIGRALVFLVDQGLVIETRRKSLPPYYRLNSRRRAARSKLLREL